MKLQHLGLIAAALVFTPQSHAEGWLDSLKSMFGMEVEAEKPVMPNVTAMISSVGETLGVSDTQATGGLASIFNYAKSNLSSEQFSGLTESMPGLDGLLSSVPDISNMASEGQLGGLMDKAASYSDSIAAINAVKKQFEALGLEPEMIMQYINAAKAYLDTEEGKKIKDTLMQGLSKLTA
ncbi:DUF2780 domain-containing protein [Paraglaciecola aquimarina]|uniref:DUF2780 domain-containing protein n=1 Tax=Paraglaciecola aquimarina TaxID=1235557 RepID=A0ABU3SZJ6_9ALTE|nr:DUF2780 domain-containing protein [Paraglaciecola aquimarina]MDU0355416.1 DUF2780 domain-containing protein [Paraglaciecola aquimarina]